MTMQIIEVLPDTQNIQSNVKILQHFTGIRIIPEIDQPAHAGYGWNFPEAEGFVACLSQEPWNDYCVEPPCGQVI